MPEQQFDQWCIVELFGHQRIAGRVTEQQVGGCNFVRVDIPPVGNRPGFTRLLGQGAIYAINPVTEQIARAAAAAYRAEPVTPYGLPELHQAQLESQREPLDVVDDRCPECGEFEPECICNGAPF